MKLGLFQAAALLLFTKKLDDDLNGFLSVQEAASLEDFSATQVLKQLSLAKSYLMQAAIDDPALQKAAEVLAVHEAKIDATPGDTPEDRLRNYLASTNPNGAAGGGSTFSLHGAEVAIRANRHALVDLDRPTYPSASRSIQSALLLTGNKTAGKTGTGNIAKCQEGS